MKSLLFTSTLFLLITCCLLPHSAAQICGNDDADQQQWLPRYLHHLRTPAAAAAIRSNPREVPVVFHLEARSNGGSRPQVWRALTVLCEWNKLFSPADFSFYLPPDGIRLIDSDGIFFDHQLALNQSEMRSLKADSAINVFVVNNAGATGVVGYYDSGDDWLIVQRSAFVSGNRTTVHEAGHFFSLMHPYLGWDAAAWNASIHGNPAPALASDGSTATERMDGSNCMAAGDRLCDTPPDYNFGLDWQQSCTYSGTAMDPNGVLVDPDERLIMSYFSDSCRDTFSPAQITLMQADWDDPARAFLHSSHSSDDTLTNSPLPLLPQGPIPLIEDSIQFVWQDLPGATNYYLEVDRSADFDLAPIGLITSDTSFTLQADWLYSTQYYWRVFGWNGSQTCLPPSAAQAFDLFPATGIHRESVISLQVKQEPLAGIYHVQFQLPIPRQVEVEVLSVSGKVCYQQSFSSPAGPVSHTIHLPFLPAGIYLLRLKGLSQAYHLIRIGT